MPNYKFQMYDEYRPYKTRHGFGPTPEDAFLNMLQNHRDASPSAIYKIVSSDAKDGYPNSRYYRMNVEIFGDKEMKVVLKDAKTSKERTPQ